VFPTIIHIDDVLPYIEGRNEFVVADRGNHTIINYVVVTPTSFQWPEDPSVSVDERYARSIRRECRGLVFNAKGQLIRRPWHKFKNVNEADEYQACVFDLGQPHCIQTKLDGSMISPFSVSTRIIWGTRMGDTDVATQATDFAKKNLRYEDAYQNADTCGYTLMFEWMSRKQRIVVDHPEDQLILTGMRNTNFGHYVLQDELIEFGARHNIPVVDAIESAGTSINDLLEHIKIQEGTEGAVIAFNSGFRAKIKSEWYLKIHGAKDAITEEKNVVQMIIDSTLDDAKALVLEEDRKNLDRYEGDFWDLATAYSWNLTGKINEAKEQFADRKDFAINGKPKNQYHRSATFAFFDEAVNHPTVLRYVIEKIIRPALSTRTKYGVMKSEVLHGLRQYV
jgi:RNA ligase